MTISSILRNKITAVFIMTVIYFLPCMMVAQGGSAQLGFLVWGAGEPTYCEPGKTGSFSDGDKLSMVHETEGFNFGSDVFTIEMKINNNTVAHSFKIADKTAISGGAASWIIVDPSGTDYVPSFTDKFLVELCKLPKGKIKVDIAFKVNNKVLQSGSLSYNSDGKHAKYKALIPKFANVKGARDEYNQAHLKDLEEQERKQEEPDRQKEKANSFTVTIQNKNEVYTYYIISIDQKTLSETIYEVLPDKSTSIDLYKSKSYELKAYSQNESKEDARSLGIVDQKSNNKTITVR